jgi:hypothetical protein
MFLRAHAFIYFFLQRRFPLCGCRNGQIYKSNYHTLCHILKVICSMDITNSSYITRLFSLSNITNHAGRPSGRPINLLRMCKSHVKVLNLLCIHVSHCKIWRVVCYHTTGKSEQGGTLHPPWIDYHIPSKSSPLALSFVYRLFLKPLVKKIHNTNTCIK